MPVLLASLGCAFRPWITLNRLRFGANTSPERSRFLAIRGSPIGSAGVHHRCPDGNRVLPNCAIGDLIVLGPCDLSEKAYTVDISVLFLHTRPSLLLPIPSPPGFSFSRNSQTSFPSTLRTSVAHRRTQQCCQQKNPHHLHNVGRTHLCRCVCAQLQERPLPCDSRQSLQRFVVR